VHPLYSSVSSPTGYFPVIVRYMILNTTEVEMMLSDMQYNTFLNYLVAAIVTKRGKQVFAK